MPPSFPISIQPILPYIIWPGHDTLLTCQFHSLFKIKKKHTYIPSLFNFISARAWSGPFCPCHAGPSDGQ